LRIRRRRSERVLAEISAQILSLLALKPHVVIARSVREEPAPGCRVRLGPKVL
jgi:hypothetical protein